MKKFIYKKTTRNYRKPNTRRYLGWVATKWRWQIHRFGHQNWKRCGQMALMESMWHHYEAYVQRKRSCEDGVSIWCFEKKNLNGFILKGIWVVYFMWGCFEHLSDAYIYVDGLLGQLSFVCHLFVREICYVGREMCRTEFGILALFLSRGIFLKISHFTPDRSDPSISILSSNWK